MITKEAILGIFVGLLIYSIITKYSDIFNNNSNSSNYSRKDQDAINHDDACIYMQHKYNIKTTESFYDLKIDVQERFFKLGM